MFGAACQPSLPSPFPDSGRAASSATEPHAVLEPEAPLDSAPRAVRIHIVPSPGASVDTSRLLLVRGHVGKAHLRQVEQDEISAALSERVLPALAWPDGDAGVLAPLAALTPGDTYGILSASPPLALDLTVAETDPLPFFPRVWPPPDSPEPAPFALHCGDTPVNASPSFLTLAPSATPAAWSSGIPAHLAPNCLRIDLSPDSPSGDSPSDNGPSGDSASADSPSGDSPSAGSPSADSPSADSPSADTSSPSDASDPPSPDEITLTGAPDTDPATLVLPPPLLPVQDGAAIRLDPLPLSRTLPLSPIPLAPADCDPEQVTFGPACARVADDRLFLATPEIPLFWSVHSEATGHLTFTTSASDPWTLTGLRPSKIEDLEITAVDLSGVTLTTTATVIMSPPMPHVVISEVLANPLGAEPDQEWVELYNDGLAPASLEGYVLGDIGGETVLPAATLAPGAYALIVNESFQPDDDLDPLPRTGTLLLRVPKLGKTGLKNDGEPLKLSTPGSEIVSRFPAAPKPGPGESVARRTASSSSLAPSSFKVGPPTPGAPN